MLLRAAQLLVMLTGLYFVALAALALLAPARVTRFLTGFAATAARHYLELLLRLAVGVGFVLAAPRMRYADAFTLFGWVLVGTTVCLFVVPWSWHHRFAHSAVPIALRHLRWLAVASLLMGGVVLASLIAGHLGE